jgi:hypothetical protein
MTDGLLPASGTGGAGQDTQSRDTVRCDPGQSRRDHQGGIVSARQFYLLLVLVGAVWAGLGAWIAGAPGFFLGWLGVALGAVVRAVKAELDELDRQLS